MHSRAQASGARRVAAFALDYVVLAAYIALLTSIGVAARAAVQQRLTLPRTATAKIGGHAVAFLTLTVPVTLYFALFEASRAQATAGKRVLGLRVTTTDGARVPLGHSLLRSAIKFVPSKNSPASQVAGAGDRVTTKPRRSRRLVSRRAVRWGLTGW